MLVALADRCLIKRPLSAESVMSSASTQRVPDPPDPPDRPDPRVATVSFAGVDGCRLFGRGWLPDGQAEAVVIVAHGLSEHSGRYRHVGTTFADHGYATWALDHRGHGRSAGRPVFVRTFDEYVADLETFRQLVAERHPALPTVLLGHSMGGAIATAHAIDHPDHFDGLMLTGPALQPSLGIPKTAVAIGRLMAKVRPTLGIMAPDGAKVSRDPAVVAAYRADPLVRRGKVTAGLGVALLVRAARFPDELGGVRLPLLIIHGDADALGARGVEPEPGAPLRISGHHLHGGAGFVPRGVERTGAGADHDHHGAMDGPAPQGGGSGR